MTYSMFLRLLSGAAFLVGLGLGFVKSYDHAAFLIVIAVYMRCMANEEDK